MNRWLHRTFVISAVVAVAILVIAQITWFAKAYRLEEQQFDDKVNLALREAADLLLDEQNNFTSRIPPVKQIASNAYSLNLHHPVRYEKTDSIVRLSLAKQHIEMPMTLAVRELSTDVLILGGFHKRIFGSKAGACAGRDEYLMPINITITFPGKRAEILAAHTFWIISAIVLFIIIILGSYLIFDLKRQNRLTLMKNEFINNMTHELNTPIANISMASEVLGSDRTLDQKEKAKRYIDIIREENTRLKLHVEQVLRTMQLEKGQLRLAQQKIDVNALLNDVTEQFTSRVRLRDGQIISKLQAINAIVVGDVFHLRNMFCNLLDNADKYSTENPAIVIETSNQNDILQVKVIDQGIGIAQEAQRFIFEKFYRASTGLRHDIKGFGLGLTYVQQIVKAHGGTVQVDSIENQGSCFTISLPLQS